MGRLKREHELLSIFKESRTNIILGPKGVGKTNITVAIMRLLVSLGFDVWTNIHFFDFDDVKEAISRKKLPSGVHYLRKPDEIHTISTLSELLYGLLKPGMKAVFIDEAGIVSPTGTSKDTKTIKQLAYIIRHFSCAFTLITQVAGSVPPDLRENLVDYKLDIIKYKKIRSLQIGKRSVSTDEDGEKYIAFPIVKTIGHVPMANIAFDGKFPSTFEIDIDLKKTLDAFGKVKSSLELEKGKGKAILDKLTSKSKGEAIRRAKIKRATARLKRDKHGKFLPVDHSTEPLPVI